MTDDLCTRLLEAIERAEGLAHWRLEDCAQFSQAEIDPDSVLRLCQAHREIVEDYDRATESRKAHPDDLAAAGALLALHGVVRVLASAYGIQEET